MNLEDNKKAFMELLRIPSVTGSGADGEEKACAFLEHILQENGIKTERIAKDLHRPNLLAAIHAPRAEKEPVVLISHIPLKFFFRGIKAIVFIVLLTVALQMFMTPGEPLWRWGFLTITKYHCIVSFFDTIPVVITIHCIITTMDTCDFTNTDLFHLLL